ncbi:threonine/serine exporter family protein [Clostridium sp. SYSU_GA19001]|uniref:threonine/serine exporter family protein n=1 Tax=Clostridium caldaquaticum TaxID=2940653 RepID=UPI00207766F5|nr:threonine/serine exporter family protein [Clostridium caldaquaticum]MCM8710450.1 threonine/serine exporter family protein [Clostridium caldaquaticum]
MLLKSLYSFLATLSFGVLFNIKGKNLLFASLGGSLTWYIYLAVLNYSNYNLFALFASSLFAGIYSEIFARILKSPVTTFSVCSIITLVPGGGMYYTMLQSVQGNINMFLSTGLDTISSAGAIAVGILLASSITKVIVFIHRIRKTSRQN